MVRSGSKLLLPNAVPKVYILIVNYKYWQETIQCLKSILKLNYDNYQVVVIDNNSPNNAARHLRTWCKRHLPYVYYTKEEAENGGNSSLENLVVRRAHPLKRLNTAKQPVILIQSGANLYYSGGNNLGIRYSFAKNDFEYIWILNNDTVVDKDSLRYLVEKAEHFKKENKKIGIIGSKLLYLNRPEIIQTLGGKYNKWLGITKHIGLFEKDEGQFDRDNIKMDYVIGASMLISKNFVEEVGLICEDYESYFEELDWIERAKRKDWTFSYDWRSKVYHKEGGSIGSSALSKQRSELADFHGFRSRILFAKRFYPQHILGVYFGFIITAFNRIKRKQFRRLKLIFHAIFNNASSI